MYETSCQSRFDARYWMLGAGALGRPRGIKYTNVDTIASNRVIGGSIEPIVENGTFEHFIVKYSVAELLWCVIIIIHSFDFSLSFGASGTRNNFKLFSNLLRKKCKYIELFNHYQNSYLEYLHHSKVIPCIHLKSISIPMPAPSIQYRASNLDWQLVSYMIFYMFQCHSPKSSHPLTLRVHKTVLYISVSFAVLYTGLLLPSF